MPVTGAKEVSTALRRAPNLVRAEVRQAVAEIAERILRDMRSFVPVDTGELRAGLDKAFSESGLSARIGLVTAQAASDLFYARFIELGTVGGQVTYRRAGSQTRHVMNVPARPATPFMDPALRANRPELERRIWQAIEEGLRAAG